MGRRRRLRAVDLALGRVTRPHEDLEIVVPAGMFPALRDALGEFAFVVPFPEGLRPVDDAGGDGAESHQTWARDGEGRYRFDVMREPREDAVWIYRRDPSIRRAYADAVSVGSGVPHLVPEIVLLFKAKHLRPKDEDDFEQLLPHLEPSARAWVAGALARVHPGHVWLHRLDASVPTDRSPTSPQ